MRLERLGDPASRVKKTPTMKCAILSACNHPFVGYQLAALRRLGVIPETIVLDEKPLSQADLAIIAARTAGRMPPRHLPEDVPVLSVANHNGPETIDALRSVDFALNAGTPRILKGEVLEASRLGVLNCHPGMLPAFRGCSCVEWALWLGEPVGNTVHWMTKGIDEGPILIREAVVIDDADTYVDVRTRVYEQGIRLLTQTAADLISGRRDPAGESQDRGWYWPPIPDAYVEQLKTHMPAATDGVVFRAHRDRRRQ